jgi:nitrogen fixation negative regulator NifL
MSPDKPSASARLYRDLVENSPDMIHLVDPQGVFLYVNQTERDRLGYELEELRRMRLPDLAPEKEKARIERHLKEVKELGHSIIDTVLLSKSGELIEVEMVDRAAYDANGVFVRSRSYVREITGRRSLESRINLLYNAFQHSTDAIVITDLEGRIIEVNQAFTDLYGWERHEVLGRTTNILRSSKTSNDLYRSMWLSITQTGSWKGEIVNRRRDGSEVPILLSITPLYENGEMIGYMGVGINITDKKRAEEQLQREKEFTEQLIETANSLIVGLDLEGRIILLNRRFQEVTGYTKSEAMGKPWFDLFVPERYRDSVQEAFDNLVEGRLPSNHENPILTRNGEERLISWSNTPIWDEHHRVIGVLGIGQDITEQKNLQRQVLQAERLATIGKMAAKVAHEIRNPLSSISLNAELLVDELDSYAGADTREAKNLLRAILDEVERVTSLTEEYLQFSRLPQAEFERADPNRVVEELAEFYREHLAQKNITWEHVLDSTIGEIPMDRMQIRRALMNLIRNAIEAMPRGGHLKVSTQKLQCGALISISDTGYGIDPETQDKIFDPFFTTKDMGTGLGLAITQQIVAEHKGRLVFRSEKGRGTTFSIMLPYIQQTTR